MKSETGTTERTSSPDALTELTLQALERISVERPYFALTDLEHTGDGRSITATVPASPPLTPEVGAIEAAQAARHLAILGSCAAALSSTNDRRHHYLAMSATYERLGPATGEPITSPMQAVATAEWQDKRTATATMTLSDAIGEPLNRLTVNYAVMKPAMFARLNPKLVVAAAATAEHDSPVLVEKARGQVIVDSGRVPGDLCAGHFPDLPVAPIALVMGRLVRTARDALCSHLGADVDYRVEGGTVEATGLAQLGQRLVLEAHYDRLEPDGTHWLVGRALADDVEVGAVNVNLAAITDQARHDQPR